MEGRLGIQAEATQRDARLRQQTYAFPPQPGAEQPMPKRSLKPSGRGYDFSTSLEQTRRVRFNFGVRGSQSLAVDATLAKLFESLTVECSGVLVQPQWKHFRHFDMMKNDQIRLSNGIWRSWHIKYQKNREPLFCTFKLNTNLNDHARPEAVVLEGKYQKRKVDAVAREYRKWRIHHKEKHRQNGGRRDPLLEDLLNIAHGNELGGGSQAGPQAMQVDPPMAGFIQLAELPDSLLMNFGQEYLDYPEQSTSSNIMIQPSLDVLSSTLDELLGKLEPMEVMLSRSTTSTNYQSPSPLLTTNTPTFPTSPNPTTPLQQMVSPQLTPTPTLPPRTPHTSHLSQTPPTMQAQPLSLSMATNVTDSPFSFSSPSSSLPRQSPQQSPSFQPYSSGHRGNNDITPMRTPPPPAQFPFAQLFSGAPQKTVGMERGGVRDQRVGSTVMGGFQQPSTNFAMKPDPSTTEVQMMGTQGLGNFRPPMGGNFTVPPARAHQPTPSPLARPDLSSATNSNMMSNYSNMSGQQPMGGVAMDTELPKDLNLSMLTQLISSTDPPTVNPVPNPPMGGAGLSHMTSVANSAPSQYGASTIMAEGRGGGGGGRVGGGGVLGGGVGGGGVLGVGGGGVGSGGGGGGGGGSGVGSKRREDFFQFSQGLSSLPDTKRRSPFSSQTEFPSSSFRPEVQFTSTSTMPPPHAPLFSRRASLGSSPLPAPSERPHLEKNRSEPAGSMVLKEQVKLLSQQQEKQLHDLDQRQSAAQQQYQEVLQQYLQQVVSQNQVSEQDQQLLQAVLSNPTLVSILRTILTTIPPSSTSSPFSQPSQSPLLPTPSPTPAPSFPSLPPAPSSRPLSLLSNTEREQAPMMEDSSPSEAAKVADFQSRLLVAAAVQASGGPHGHDFSTPVTSSSQASVSFSSDVDLSPGSSKMLASSKKIKSMRSMSTEEKEVYKEIRRQSHISAEQKRRGTIKQGFEQLQSLVVNPATYPGGKVSKATILEKTVEHIQHVHQERENRERQMEALRKELEELNTAIAHCQENLPASGVPATRQRFEDNRRRFQEYVQRRTLQNYKFWIYSIILQQLFDSYNSTVSTGNQEELCRTVLAWFEQNCSLHALRPVVMNSLKELSTKTSILSEPSQVPQQLVKYAKQQLRASHDFT